MKRLLDDWVNGLWEFVVLAVAFLLLAACLSGCINTRADSETQRIVRTVTITKAQTISPSGEIVELTTRTTVTTDEQTGQTTTGTTEVEPPKILGSLAKIAGTAVGGPAMGAAAQQGVDWLTMALTGGGAAATAAGTGYAALHRPAQARRRRLEEELEAEREEREAKEKALRQVVKGVDAWKESRTEKDDAAKDLLRVLKESTDEDARLAIKQAKAHA